MFVSLLTDVDRSVTLVVLKNISFNIRFYHTCQTYIKYDILFWVIKKLTILKTNKIKYKKTQTNKTSNYHSFIKQLVHSMQVLSVIGKFTYLISNKHFIAPVKINIIFILPDVLKNLSICNLQHHTWTSIPTTEIYIK